MEQLAVSELQQITAEINTFKQVAGQAVFEIGRRLKHVRDKDLTHGQWDVWCEKELNMTRRQANKYIRVFDRFSNGKLTSHSTIEALDALTDFTDEELAKPHALESGETKHVDEMTVREIREAKRLQREAEQRAERAETERKRIESQAIDVQNANRMLREQNEQLKREKNAVPTVKIERIETEPPDYRLIQIENRELKMKNDSLQAELQVIKNPMLPNKFEVKKRKQDLNQDARALASKVEVFIKEIAPLAYLSRLIVDADADIRNEYEEALSILERWVFDVRQNIKQTSNQRSSEIIDIDSMEVEHV